MSIITDVISIAMLNGMKGKKRHLLGPLNGRKVEDCVRLSAVICPD